MALSAKLGDSVLFCRERRGPLVGGHRILLFRKRNLVEKVKCEERVSVAGV